VPGPLRVALPPLLPLVERVLGELVHAPLVTRLEGSDRDAGRRLGHIRFARHRELEKPLGDERGVPAGPQEYDRRLIAVGDGLGEAVTAEPAGPVLGPGEQESAQAPAGVRGMDVDRGASASHPGPAGRFSGGVVQEHRLGRRLRRRCAEVGGDAVDARGGTTVQRELARGDQSMNLGSV